MMKAKVENNLVNYLNYSGVLNFDNLTSAKTVRRKRLHNYLQRIYLSQKSESIAEKTTLVEVCDARGSRRP
jgi:hypothetical protein